MWKNNKKLWEKIIEEIEILKNLDQKYSKKSLENLEELKEEDLFSDTAFIIIFQQYFYSHYIKMMENESKIARAEVWNHNLNFEKIKKHIWELIRKFALEINATTKAEILEIIKEGLKNGVWYEQIKTNVKNKFSQYKKSRVEKIARTEVTRWVNKAREETWKQNPRVTYKKWWTSLDERVSKECWALHWKKIAINENFYNLWDKDWNGKVVDYEDISWPPKHVNCRCDLIPVLDYLDE